MTLDSIHILTLGAIFTSVRGHGRVTVPTPRGTGAQHTALCGSGLVTELEKDKAGPIENAIKKKDDGYNCNAYLCRSYQYEDNFDKVQSVTAGENINFRVEIVTGYRPAYANVSIVDTATNKILVPLKEWPGWPCDKNYPCDDDDNFNITIPNTLRQECTKAGQCVIQWYWYIPKSTQTYESCVDIVSVYISL